MIFVISLLNFFFCKCKMTSFYLLTCNHNNFCLWLFREIGYSHLSPEGILINCLGVILVVFTGLVVYLVTKPEYKRQPAPEEDHVPLDN